MSATISITVTVPITELLQIWLQTGQTFPCQPRAERRCWSEPDVAAEAKPFFYPEYNRFAEKVMRFTEQIATYVTKPDREPIMYALHLSDLIAECRHLRFQAGNDLLIQDLKGIEDLLGEEARKLQAVRTYRLPEIPVPEIPILYDLTDLSRAIDLFYTVNELVLQFKLDQTVPAKVDTDPALLKFLIIQFLLREIPLCLKLADGKENLSNVFLKFKSVLPEVWQTLFDQIFSNFTCCSLQKPAFLDVGRPELKNLLHFSSLCDLLGLFCINEPVVKELEDFLFQFCLHFLEENGDRPVQQKKNQVLGSIEAVISFLVDLTSILDPTVIPNEQGQVLALVGVKLLKICQNLLQRLALQIDGGLGSSGDRPDTGTEEEEIIDRYFEMIMFPDCIDFCFPKESPVAIFLVKRGRDIFRLFIRSGLYALIPKASNLICLIVDFLLPKVIELATFSETWKKMILDLWKASRGKYFPKKDQNVSSHPDSSLDDLTDEDDDLKEKPYKTITDLSTGSDISETDTVGTDDSWPTSMADV